ncbi:hypothetical protein CI784_07070 [Arthrobacter agilis]|nr:hypothetical protein B8W74_04780 [Arthrobacter agilis]PPB46567.1 hypothetical protein CI784_07070 [Arthrobacter agilis]VDR32507.1 Uncharacterised protein [Arthrobacter agilis]
MFSFLNYFPVILRDHIDGPVELAAAEFSAITTLGPAVPAIESLVQSKIWEMTEDQRVDFRTKLSVFVGRPELKA